MDPKLNHTHRVNYLIEAASRLPTNSYYQKLLRSYYLTNCKRLAQPDEKQSNSFLSEQEMCRKCSTPWFDANFSLSIAPIKATQRKARKIHKQIEEKSKRKGNLARKLSKRVNNTMTIKCELCKNKSKVTLWKKAAAEPKSSSTNPNQIKTAETTSIVKKETLLEEIPKQQPVMKSKKKKKKDKNAGLLFSVNKVDNSVKKVDISTKMKFLNIQKVADSSTENKNNPSKQSKRISKNNSVKIKKITPPPVMKRNSLLQLAHALKAKGNQSGSNSQADKLKKLLR